MPGPHSGGVPSTRLVGRPAHVGAHRDVLRLIAEFKPLAEILSAIATGVEAQLPGSLASILLIADDGEHLTVGAAPSLSTQFSQAVDGAAIGPAAGTCGTAIYRGSMVITDNIAIDPAWDNWRPAAEREGLAACWSTPFAGEHDQLLGTFAVYFRESRRPNPEELAILYDAGWLAAIAVQTAATRTELDRMAGTDRLTGLPDRAGWEASVETGRDGAQAVYAIGIDGFAAVNESLGYEAGDELMRLLAHRLVAAAGPEAVVGRIDGDEFAVGIPQPRDGADPVQLGHRLRSAMTPPAKIAAHDLHPDATIGLSVNAAGTDPGESLRRAKAALGRARGAGEPLALNGIAEEAAAEDLSLATDLMSGFAAHEMAMVYQPIIELATGRIVRFEALMRWHSARRGTVPPQLFIPAAERSGLIRALGRFAIAEALHGLERLLADPATPRSAGVAVNISALELRDPNLVDLVEQLLRRWALSPGILTLEVTENALLHDGSAFDGLARLRDLGVRIAIDDFGVGFSQLTYLREFPFDEIKIDRSFVTDIVDDPQARSIVENLISLANDLDVELVAEGIETDEQRAVLVELGCRYGQGFLLGRPAATQLR